MPPNQFERSGLYLKIMGRAAKYFTALKYVTVGLLLSVATVVFVVVINAGLHFPYDVDIPLTTREVDAARKYYTEAYKKPISEDREKSEYETEYIRVAESAAKNFRIEEQVSAFVKQYGLTNRPVLEIGSGRGYLQDVAQNYTGLDITPSVARFYHKKFVLGSATAMPFADDSFDGVWSIWVFEHVPNPEQAFAEARRVTRNKGVIFLLPEWNCPPWAADGYEVRPYSEFGIAGKVIKASIPLRSTLSFRALTLIPIRVVRGFFIESGPTRLRYRRLSPNYEKYWVSDSDAVNSIDIHEAMLWFVSRGDECLNCKDSSVLLPVTRMPLIIRVHK
jgi:SAM-dependent methyltransferase